MNVTLTFYSHASKEMIEEVWIKTSPLFIPVKVTQELTIGTFV